MIVAHICKYTKNHLIVHFKCMWTIKWLNKAVYKKHKDTENLKINNSKRYNMQIPVK